MKQTDASLKSWLTQAVAVGGNYPDTTTEIGVYTAIDDKGAATALSDVTEGTGGLATRVAVTWGDPYKLTDGRWAVDSNAAAFTIASAAQTQNILGWMLVFNTVTDLLLAWANLSEPVNMIDENSQWSIVVRLTIDPDGRFSAEITWNG